MALSSYYLIKTVHGSEQQTEQAGGEFDLHPAVIQVIGYGGVPFGREILVGLCQVCWNIKMANNCYE
jgi:hypothetical protein